MHALNANLVLYFIKTLLLSPDFFVEIAIFWLIFRKFTLDFKEFLRVFGYIFKKKLK